MAYTTPATWSVGESPTAAKMNQQIRDNVDFLRDDTELCFLYSSGTQTLTNTTWTAINFDVEAVDNASMHSAGTPASIMVPTTGYYWAWAVGGFASATNSVALSARFTTNGTVAIPQQVRVPGCSQDGNGPVIHTVLGLGAGDAVQLNLWHNAGPDLATVAYGSVFGIRRFGG